MTMSSDTSPSSAPDARGSDRTRPDGVESGAVLAVATVLIRYRKLLWRYPVFIAIVVTGLSFLFANVYRSRVTVLPPERDFQSTSQPVGELKSLLSGGMALPVMATPSDILAAVMESRSARDSVVDRLALETRWNQTRDRASELLRSVVGVKVDPTGIVEVWAEDENRWFADTLVSTLVESADRINQAVVNTRARKTREFVQGRLDETKRTLDKAAAALEQFQNEHHTVALDAEIKAMIENAAKLRAQMTADQIELSVSESSLSPEHPGVRALRTRIQQTQQKLNEIERPSLRDSTPAFLATGLTELPRLSQELAVRLRDVKVAEALYELLTEQFEHARIQEERDTPTFSVLDRAVGGGAKVRPKRLIIALATLVTGFVLVSAFALWRTYLEHLASSDPAQHRSIVALWDALRPRRRHPSAGGAP